MINYKELEDKIYNYPTKYPEGFTFEELKKIIADYPDVNMKYFDSAMTGNTCIMKVEDDKPIIVNYHCDVYKSIVCGLEGRDLRAEEWD